jgi:hypothetical protein
MSKTLNHIWDLAERNELKILDHGYDELAADNILVREIVHSLKKAELLEDYPDYFKGPCVLLLQYDGKRKPVHTVWGIPKGNTSPAVLITAYRPDPLRWSKDFRRRIK